MDINTKTIIEILSAILILAGFELFNRRSIKAFYIMAIGQFLAMIICGYATLWFLSFMHFVNFLMQIRGWLKWKKNKIENYGKR
jgi:hypothetical protein